MRSHMPSHDQKTSGIRSSQVLAMEENSPKTLSPDHLSTQTFKRCEFHFHVEFEWIHCTCWMVLFNRKLVWLKLFCKIWKLFFPCQPRFLLFLWHHTLTTGVIIYSGNQLFSPLTEHFQTNSCGPNTTCIDCQTSVITCVTYGNPSLFQVAVGQHKFFVDNMTWLIEPCKVVLQEWRVNWNSHRHCK